MRDTEFYSLEENWPQPPDDACTLEAIAPNAPVAGRKKKSFSKVRKKMSESLAGVTAAAVAVVMVATAIPSLKDAFDDFPHLPDFGTREICPVCNYEECPFFVDGNPGLCVSLDSDPEYSDSEDIYTMSGFSRDDDLYLYRNYPCIFTENGTRIIIRFKNDIRSLLPIHDMEEHPVVNNTRLTEDGEPAYTGMIWYGEDEKSSGQENYLYAVVAYNQYGEAPLIDPFRVMSHQEYISFDPQEPNYHVSDVPNMPHTQVQIISNLDKELLAEFVTCIEVITMDSATDFALGKTMLFTESEDCRRNFADMEYWSTTSYHGFNHQDGDQMRSLCIQVRCKEYWIEISNFEQTIIFNDTGWKAVFDRWRDLNEQASESGHEVYYPVEELEDITVNGITYSCYIVYTAESVDDVNGYPWIWYYLVPQQEETIAIMDRQSISPEELQKLIEERSVDRFSLEVLLDQITLR